MLFHTLPFHLDGYVPANITMHLKNVERHNKFLCHTSIFPSRYSVRNAGWIIIERVTLVFVYYFPETWTKEGLAQGAFNMMRISKNQF